MATAPALRTPWKDRLQITATGGYKPNLFNACCAFREAAEFRGRLSFDQFSMRTEVVGPLPWRNDNPRWWDNYDDTAATFWLQQQDLNIGRQIVQQAIELVAWENRRHPVVDWLRNLKWDRQPRIDDWLTYYLGVTRTSYAQAVGRAFLVQAIARIMMPGCKADHVLILEGPQGVRKSTAVRTLAGPWFTDELAEFGSKDAGLQMRGVWIIELPELDNFTRAEVSKIKAFISRTTDRFRPPYGDRIIEAPRECVFLGTVNEDEYLKDATGGRRFWPVRVGQSIDIEALARDREQLWAEALHAYESGEPWWLEDSSLKAAAHSEQTARHEDDPWLAIIARWVAEKGRTRFTADEILVDVLDKRKGDISRLDYLRTAKVLKKLGFERGTIRIGGEPIKGWKSPVLE